MSTETEILLPVIADLQSNELLKQCLSNRERLLLLRVIKETLIRRQDFETAVPYRTAEKRLRSRASATELLTQLDAFGDDCSELCKAMRANLRKFLKGKSKFIIISIQTKHPKKKSPRPSFA